MNALAREKWLADNGLPPENYEQSQIAKMLVPQGPTDENNAIPFTCKHYDTEKRLCTIYDVRPRMCRNFGVKHPCTYEGCAWNGAMREESPKA